MIPGFNVKKALVCEGIIGDGCGGGRLFFIDQEKLYAYDPLTKEAMLLQSGITQAQKIYKKGCIITVETTQERLTFDLSKL